MCCVIVLNCQDNLRVIWEGSHTFCFSTFKILYFNSKCLYNNLEEVKNELLRDIADYKRRALRNRTPLNALAK